MLKRKSPTRICSTPEPSAISTRLSRALRIVAAFVFATIAFAPVAALAECNQLYGRYEGTSWWWGAFGNCKKPGGTVDPDTIFNCAWGQVPARDNGNGCLRQMLRSSPSTERGIAAVAAYNSFYDKYEGSSWWWGAFGNCKEYGGTVNPDKIFDCAYNQVPEPERSPFLQQKLRLSESTRRGIDAVIASNTVPSCEQLYAKYERSSWWWGAFGNCKKYGGTTDRTQIWDCAWLQVPKPDATPCLKDKLYSSDVTRRAIDAVIASNSWRKPTSTAPVPSRLDKCSARGRAVSLDSRTYVGEPRCGVHTIDANWNLEVKSYLDCDDNGYVCCYSEAGANHPTCGEGRQALNNLECSSGYLVQPWGCFRDKF